MTTGLTFNRETAGFYEWCDWNAEKSLERLVFSVSKKPKYLQAHLERIYYCFQEQLDEQLLGALIDLLIVLNKDGAALGRRMIAGSKSRLTETQFKELTHYINHKEAQSDLLLHNRYSVFTKGILSAKALVHIVEDKVETEHDPLALARNYIEFSQLDNATQVLEQAILDNPERLELHGELLSLYRSTRNKKGFFRIYIALTTKSLPLPPEWKQLNDFFAGLSADEK